MKKSVPFLILFLCLLLTAVCAMSACETKSGESEEEPLFDGSITVMSDIHVLASSQYGDTVTKSFQRILENNEKCIGLTEAIFKTAIDDFIASKSEILIISGDLTDNGARVAHQLVADELKRAEEAGKRCYVINGNHDINNKALSYKNDTTEVIENVTPELFADIFADFGYSEALVRDEGSLSYTAELNDKYRLIALDTAYYDLNENPETAYDVTGRHLPGVTDELIYWFEEQLEQCFFDGKEPFLVTHFPILTHVGAIGESMTCVNRQEDILSAIHSGNVSFGFCGHVHQQDIATYDFGDGRTFYEIETGSLSFTTLPVRKFIDNGETVQITTGKVEKVNADYLPSFYTEEQKATILADLQSWVWEEEDSIFSVRLHDKIEWEDIVSFLGVKAGDKEGKALVSSIQKMYDEFYYLPIYKSQGENSLEAICERYGVTDFPQGTGIKNIGTLLVFYLKKNFSGDEVTTINDPEVTLLKYALYTAFTYIEEEGIIEAIHTANGDIRTFSIASDLGMLYREGKLEISANGLLGIAYDLPVVQRLLSKVSILSGLVSEDAVETARAIDNLLSQQLIWDLIGETDFGFITDGLFYDGKTVSDYFDFTDLEEEGKSYLCLGNLVDCLVESLGAGLLNDEGASDNNFSFPSPAYNYNAR